MDILDVIQRMSKATCLNADQLLQNFWSSDTAWAGCKYTPSVWKQTAHMWNPDWMGIYIASRDIELPLI